MAISQYVTNMNPPTPESVLTFDRLMSDMAKVFAVPADKVRGAPANTAVEVQERRLRFERSFQPLFGLPRIIECEFCADTVPDWDRVRSPGRARRRLRAGIRRGLPTKQVPWKHVIAFGEMLIVHPVTLVALTRRMAEAQDRMIRSSIEDAILGRRP